MNGSENIIDWNVENWLTVFLMAFLGFMVLGLVSQVLRKATAPKYADNVVPFAGAR